MIKKRHYWPAHIDGESIDWHFENKKVGDADSLRGKMLDMPFYMFEMKLPGYVIKLMRYRHVVADHNANRHCPICLEYTFLFVSVFLQFVKI